MHVRVNDQRRQSGPDKQVLSEPQKYSESTIMNLRFIFCPSPLNIKHAIVKKYAASGTKSTSKEYKKDKPNPHLHRQGSFLETTRSNRQIRLSLTIEFIIYL
jgi:hypothetical protein